MREVKDTQRSTVRMGYDGRVHKQYHGLLAKERFENEVKVLEYLDDQKCRFVPSVLEVNRDELILVTSNCGAIVDKISSERTKELFEELEGYGVKHEDAFARNITYDPREGRFCIIDFEFATLTETGEGLTTEDPRFKR